MYNELMSDKIEVPYSNGYYYPPSPRPQIAEVLKLKHSGTVLDIGAGFGNNLPPLLEHDFHIVATETNPDCLIGLNKLADEHPGRIKVMGAALETLAFTVQFDVILCTMVLHFLDPADARAAISNMQKWTKPDGINVITGYTANNPIEQLQEHGVKFLLETNELRSKYDGWKILSYEEERGTSKNALGVAFESARLIAQKT